MKTFKEIMGGIHWHFQIIAYEHKRPDGMLLDSTEIDIIEAETEEEAMAIAKNKVKHSNYIVRKAWQCSQCAIQKEMISIFNKHSHE